ncbi:hypothetical protein MNBD_CHLOROFLEXI01-2599 [hydrothermal vent metagenome]|uniref:DUF3048 domain-containing protein n=1 Tax=hydrothermal vent metagenome TaxID=652676 RepID=A0A3B0VIV7_9ZZZZ
MVKTSQHALGIFTLLILAALQMACGGVGAAGSNIVSDLPSATAVALADTAASASSGQAVPTLTLPPPVVPTVTLPPPAIINSEPTPTLVPTATPSPTPLPVAIYSAEDFGTDRNPLTGELMADPSVLQRRPIAIKISNNPASYTRPQHGIGQADIVFEHVTETNITRFTAIFYGQTPPDIGPIRSARLIDKELPAMYDAAVFMSGSHPLILRAIAESDVGDRIYRETGNGFYRKEEDNGIPFEHTLFANPVGLWEAVERGNDNRTPRFSTTMAFDSTPPPDGDPAAYVELNYSTWSKVVWEYDAENGRYYRTVDDEPFIDDNNGEQVSAANVIILYAPHNFDREICVYPREDGGCDLYSTEIQIWGRGFAMIIRDGQKYNVTWLRQNRRDMFTFIDAEGNPVPLQVGNSWFQIVPYYYDDPIIE